jgi:hypothetical protein
MPAVATALEIEKKLQGMRKFGNRVKLLGTGLFLNWGNASASKHEKHLID